MTSDAAAAARPPPSNNNTKRKILYLIRHAESEENRRLASLQHVLRCVWGLTWPNAKDVKAAWELVDVSGQVDSPVSSRGRDQILSMQSQLETSNFLESSGVELVLHSPLQRAKDTCYGLFPPDDDESITDADGSTTKRTTTICTRSNDVTTCPIEETDLLLEKTPMEWVFGSTFRTRMDQFVQFVQSRPESTVVAVGHSQFFRSMLGVSFKFDNCDVWRVELLCDSPSTSSMEKASSTSTTPPPLSSSCGGGDGSSPCDQQCVDGRGSSVNGEIGTLPPWSHLRRVFACPKPVEPSETDGDDHDDDKNSGVIKESEKYPSSSKDKNA